MKSTYDHSHSCPRKKGTSPYKFDKGSFFPNLINLRLLKRVHTRQHLENNAGISQLMRHFFNAGTSNVSLTLPHEFSIESPKIIFSEVKSRENTWKYTV